MIKRILISTSLVLLCGCQLAVPFIQGFKDVGFTEADRIELFTKRISEFNNSMSDGDRTGTLSFATDAFKPNFRNIIRSTGRNERVVSVTVDQIDFPEEAKKANVDVLVKYFKQTDYLVKDRLVNQIWEFDKSSGWMLSAYEVLNEDFR